MAGTGVKADASLKAPSCDGIVCKEKPADGAADASLAGEGSTGVPLAENAWISDGAEGSGSVPSAAGEAKKETEEGK